MKESFPLNQDSFCTYSNSKKMSI